jgi:uncharacterized protein YcnI
MKFSILCAAALACAATQASAHVTLEQREAAIGAPVKLTFRVPHGCGQLPTLKVRVRIPDGVIAVKPMPKPGWQLELVQGAYDKTYDYFHGAKLSQGVKEVTWTGNLPDQYYDEFAISGFLAKSAFTPGATLYFPIVQECENTAHRWIEIPKAGEPADHLKEPAPGIKLLPPK